MDNQELYDNIVEALKKVYDPEIPVNIYELGLVYGIHILDENKVSIEMTLTAPGCPIADTIVQEVHDFVAAVTGITEVKVELVFDPPWDFSKMTDAAKLELGML